MTTSTEKTPLEKLLDEYPTPWKAVPTIGAFHHHIYLDANLKGIPETPEVMEVLTDVINSASRPPAPSLDLVKLCTVLLRARENSNWDMVKEVYCVLVEALNK